MKITECTHLIECYNPSKPEEGWTEFFGSKPVPASSLTAAKDLIDRIRGKGYPLYEEVKLEFRIRVDTATTDWGDLTSETEYSSTVLDY